MFQFPSFPSCTYVFSTGSMILHHRGFPIRISPDRSLFAAPRGFSQLVTSFIGSWCQGIHLMLLLAWTSICYMVLVLFIAWVSQFFIVTWFFTRLRKDFCLSTLCATYCNNITTTFGKTNKILNYCFSHICSFSLFGCQWSFCQLPLEVVVGTMVEQTCFASLTTCAC